MIIRQLTLSVFSFHFHRFLRGNFICSQASKLWISTAPFSIISQRFHIHPRSDQLDKNAPRLHVDGRFSTRLYNGRSGQASRPSLTVSRFIFVLSWVWGAWTRMAAKTLVLTVGVVHQCKAAYSWKPISVQCIKNKNEYNQQCPHKNHLLSAETSQMRLCEKKPVTCFVSHSVWPWMGICRLQYFPPDRKRSSRVLLFLYFIVSGATNERMYSHCPFPVNLDSLRQCNIMYYMRNPRSTTNPTKIQN